MINQCVSTVSFSILLNGSPFGFFQPQGGLCQGDPISPFLFILCAKGLSRLLLRAENHGLFNGVKICRGTPHISHLMFSDDLFIFSKARVEDAVHIKEVLQRYADCSGQRINFAKSVAIFSSNLAPHARSSICHAVGIRAADHGGKYLGFPLHFPRSRRVAFTEGKDQISLKLDGWKAKCLSQAGRLTLIKKCGCHHDVLLYVNLSSPQRLV